jgi:hypothetical protein
LDVEKKKNNEEEEQEMSTEIKKERQGERDRKIENLRNNLARTVRWVCIYRLNKRQAEICCIPCLSVKIAFKA